MELRELRHQLKMLLREYAQEMHRSKVLLLNSERKLEDQFAKLDSFRSANEHAAIKLRRKARRTHFKTVVRYNHITEPHGSNAIR